ncbi:MAG TPA: glycosyltransferase [Patescibacteria group bacterium]|nr:glycosyltransferase [Patescibacteria group bacterium]
MMKLSVVIPVYRNKELLMTNLAHNYQFLKKYEIILVDDASKVGIKEEVNKNFPSFIVIKHVVNTGFSQTVNDGVAQSKGEFILLLNSDVKLRDRSFEKAMTHLKKDTSLFAVSFAQIEKDGNIVGKNSIYFSKGLFHHRKAQDISFGLNAWAEGGASIIRASYFRKLGGFDTLYAPFYWEDIDLSYRAYKRGWKVLFDPTILVEHHHESTIGKYFVKKKISKIVFRNQFIFIWKNITDAHLFFFHLIFLPFLLLKLLFKQTELFFSFFQALKKLPHILKKRNDELLKKKVSDKEILRLFMHE